MFIHGRRAGQLSEAITGRRKDGQLSVYDSSTRTGPGSPRCRARALTDQWVKPSFGSLAAAAANPQNLCHQRRFYKLTIQCADTGFFLHL